MYPLAASVTLLAHKELVFICRRRVRSRENTIVRTVRIARDTPTRTAELDQIGMVVTLRHPPGGINLEGSVAELLISNVGDIGVLCADL